MNFKLFGLFVALPFLSACQSSLKQSDLSLRSTRAMNVKNQTCVSDFKKATKRLHELLIKYPDEISGLPVQKLDIISKAATVVCQVAPLSPYGFLVDVKTSQILIEENLPSLERLFDSRGGVEQADRAGVTLRAVTYDRLLVAVAADCYAQLLGTQNTQNEILFKTLKVLEK